MWFKKKAKLTQLIGSTLFDDNTVYPAEQLKTLFGAEVIRAKQQAKTSKREAARWYVKYFAVQVNEAARNGEQSYRVDTYLQSQLYYRFLRLAFFHAGYQIKIFPDHFTISW